MLKRSIALIIFLLLAANLSAGDPWKDKPYKQWDEKDVRRILTDSPWAKAIQVDNTWGEASGGAAPSLLGSSGSAASDAPRDVLRGATPSGGPPQAAFLVRWASSRTVRRALARGAVLRGIEEAKAEEFLGQEPPEYQVVVLGPDMTPFAKTDEKALRELKERSFLAFKKTKTKFAPSRIVIQRSDDGKQVMAVYFSFSKKAESGQPTIHGDEKGAEFVCQSGKTTLKANFDLGKMADSQGADL